MYAAATQQDRKRIAAEALLIEADELGKQGGKTAPQAIEKLEQAVLVWREIGEPVWVAWSLNKVGRAHVSLNQNDKAIEYYEKALATNRELKNRYGEGAILNNLGNAYFNLRQFAKAIEFFEKSLTLFREVKDRRWEGLTIYQLGNVRMNLNEPEKAIACFEQALPIMREVKDKAFEAQALKLKEIQAQLDADTLLLEYAFGEERSYLWAISKDSLASYELPKEELIDQIAREVYEMLTSA